MLCSQRAAARRPACPVGEPRCQPCPSHAYGHRGSRPAPPSAREPMLGTARAVRRPSLESDFAASEFVGFVLRLIASAYFHAFLISGVRRRQRGQFAQIEVDYGACLGWLTAVGDIQESFACEYCGGGLQVCGCGMCVHILTGKCGGNPPSAEILAVDIAAAPAAAVPEIARPGIVDLLLLPQRASAAEAARRPALSPNTRLKTLRDANIPN